jgi:hypothetical protein
MWSRRRYQDQPANAAAAPGGIAKRDEAAKRDAADDGRRHTRYIKNAVEMPYEHVEVGSGIERQRRPRLSWQRRGDHSIFARQGGNRRLHPFPPTLNARNQHQRRAGTHVDHHQFLSVFPVFSV